MRTNCQMQRMGRRKRWARIVSITLAACAATLASGCAHVGNVFGTSEEAEKKTTIRKPPKPKVVATPAMRAQAETLRVAALEQMSRGAVGPAVSNLTKASKLDPTNEKVRHDLERALRVRNAMVSLPKSGAASDRAALD